MPKRSRVSRTNGSTVPRSSPMTTTCWRTLSSARMRIRDEIHIHWAKDHRLLKHAIADDSFLDAGDGDSLLFPGRVYKKSPAIDNPCVNSLGCLGARLNTRNRVEIVHQRSDRGRIRFRRQIDRISFAELVDCDN